jgi:hypothetical protein
MKILFKQLLCLSALLLVAAQLASCSHGPPFERVQLENVRARPNSHLIAVALQYQKLREPTGFINTFPNGGVNKVLDEKAMIYICDIDTLEVNRVVSLSPPEGVRHSWSVWILGWAEGSLYFKLTGQPGTSSKDFHNKRMIVYKYDRDGLLSEAREVPDDIAFQHNSGPLPKGPFVRVSKGHAEIDVMTEKMTQPRTLFRTVNAEKALVAVETAKTD